MPLFWSKTLEEKNVNYLLGSISKFPPEEQSLYRLSEICMRLEAAESKPTSKDHPDPKAEREGGTDDGKNRPTLTASETSLPTSQTPSDENESQNRLFLPKLPLPAPIYRQTYSMWKAVIDMNFRFWRIKRRRVIYIQPLDTFPDFISNFKYSTDGSHVGFFELLRDFMQIFFMGFEVQIRPALDTNEAGWNIKTRHHKITEKKQYLVTDINEQMKKTIPKDGYCMLGVTWTDLYPSEDLNFVLGEAAARHFTATFCFGHYEPKSYCEGKQPIEQIDGFILWRMLKVISHETCHIFNLAHCEFFLCAMNESSSLAQALSQPLFLCPVCLRKIQKVCGFGVRQRYATLLVFLKELQSRYPCDYTVAGIKWLERCLPHMTNCL